MTAARNAKPSRLFDSDVNVNGATTSPSVNQAKAFLTDYYGSYAEGVKASEGYNQPLLKDFRKKPMPIIGTDPRLELLQDFDQVARAVNDGDVNGAVEWGTQKVEAIFAKYT